jgi:thymidylate synthase
LEEDDLGPVYGHQWRHFNADYTTREASYDGKGVDQIAYIIEQLSNPETRTSRRILLSAWNPCQINQMALPPCHVLCQFNVSNGNELSCILYQRSGDIGLGVPFNIASYSMLTHMIANKTGLKAKEFIHMLGNAHIYEDHIEPLKTQISRFKDIENDKPIHFIIKENRDKLEDYTINDFSIEGYHPLDTIKMKLSA